MCIYVYIMGNHIILNIINLKYAIRYSNMVGGSIRTGIWQMLSSMWFN